MKIMDDWGYDCFLALHVFTFPHPILFPGFAAKISPKLVQVSLLAGN